MSKHEDADLILKLYDLRREKVMREARTWFLTFNPTSAQEILDVITSEHSAHYRMVVSYWDMAASLVNHGAIDETMFNDANGEHLFVYAKLAPFVTEIRSMFGAPEFLQHLETLVKRMPNIEERLTAMQERIKKMLAMFEERAKGAQA